MGGGILQKERDECIKKGRVDVPEYRIVEGKEREMQGEERRVKIKNSNCNRWYKRIKKKVFRNILEMMDGGKMEEV